MQVDGWGAWKVNVIAEDIGHTAPRPVQAQAFIPPQALPLMEQAATGEGRFFGQTFGGFLTALIMVFVVGLLAGLGSRLLQPLTSSQAFVHSRLWWPDLFLLIVGTMILVIAFSGGKQAKKNPAETTQKLQNVIDPNEARIREYRDRIEEDARKLAAEQEWGEVGELCLARPTDAGGGNGLRSS